MKLQQHNRAAFLDFLKRFFNPLTQRVAHRSFGRFALVRPVGQRSGKQYEAPMIVQPVDDGFVFELTYGAEVDCYKHALAAGSFILVWHGRQYTIGQIESPNTEPGMSFFPLPGRLLLHPMRRQHFAKMKSETTTLISPTAHRW
jgi:hypothetical protein